MAALLNFCTAVHAAALMAWFGALSLRRVLGAGQGGGELRFLKIAAGLAVASGAAWPVLQAGILGDTPGAAGDPAQVAVILTQTTFGRTWLLREACIVLAALASVLPLLAIGRGVYFLVVAALASLALIGHAAGGTGLAGSALRLALALHLLAAGAWVGALPALWVLAGRLGAADLAKVLRLFSRYGAFLVTVVVVTGALNAWSRTGSMAALVGSDYGQLLVAKVVLVALMGLAAIANRNVYTPRLATDDRFIQAGARAGLRRSMAIELALGVGVVLVAVWLGGAEAPR
jgi:putative copper resistance protein D